MRYLLLLSVLVSACTSANPEYRSEPMDMGNNSTDIVVAAAQFAARSNVSSLKRRLDK